MASRIKRSIFAMVVMLCACACTKLRPPEMVRTIDHASGNWENADLWKRVQADPGVYHPRALPAGSTISPQTGDWVVDPQDQTAYFVPNSTCGGISPAMWRAEARKAINLPKGEQRSKNMQKILVGWPAYLSLISMSAIGAGVVGGIAGADFSGLDFDPSEIKAASMKSGGMKSGGMKSGSMKSGGGGRR